jgi:hypothetical protein
LSCASPRAARASSTATRLTKITRVKSSRRDNARKDKS